MAHSIFKRWRPLYRSDELFTEINHVLGKFGNPFLALLEVKPAHDRLAKKLSIILMLSAIEHRQDDHAK